MALYMVGRALGGMPPFPKTYAEMSDAAMLKLGTYPWRSKQLKEKRRAP